MPSITKVSKDKYEAIKNIQPDNIDDRLYIHKISEAVKMTEDNIHLIWLSEDYNDYTRKYRGLLLKARSADPDKIEICLEEILESLKTQTELLKIIAGREV